PAVGSSVAAVGVSGGIRAPTQAVNTHHPNPKRNSPPNLTSINYYYYFSIYYCILRGVRISLAGPSRHLARCEDTAIFDTMGD
ncbi:hypothetical protein ACRC7T_18925, partial [Segnochrobactraceae bacterium EtOH-i3]